jgi:hypothetical protein
MLIGTRVALTKRFAKILEKNSRGKPVDWLNRQGTVVRVQRFSNIVYVKWDQRTSLDVLSIKVIRKVEM